MSKLGIRILTATALSGIAFLSVGTAQAETSAGPAKSPTLSASAVKTAPAAAKAKPAHCKLRAKIWHPVRTTVVQARVTIKCANEANRVARIDNRLELYRNGKKVDADSRHGKHSLYNLVSGGMSGTKCQKWKVDSKTLAYNVDGILRWEHAGTKSRKICP